MDPFAKVPALPALPALADLVRRALDEDCIADDVTARLLGDEANKDAMAAVVAKQPGIFSGVAVIEALGVCLPGIQFRASLAEGQAFVPKQEVATMTGSRGQILTAERTLLNFLTHLCGVATAARAFVDAVKPYKTRILATRKTLPGMRGVQLTAVRAGGAFVHRRSLADGILIKENHQRYVPVKILVERARATRSPLHRIEVEVQSFDELKSLEGIMPDVVMLDNFDDATVAEAVRWIHGRAEVEVSGNITAERAQKVAAAGADWISAGGITHSVKSVDLSLDWSVP